jgi:hypothetical protein
MGLVADEAGYLGFDVFRRDFVADVFCCVGDLLPQPVDGCRKLRAALLGVPS